MSGMKRNSQKNWQQILQKAPNHCSFLQKNAMEKSQNKIPFGLFEAKIGGEKFHVVDFTNLDFEAKNHFTRFILALSPRFTMAMWL